jgi:hypothetical protein
LVFEVAETAVDRELTVLKNDEGILGQSFFILWDRRIAADRQLSVMKNDGAVLRE